ncbi:MAG: BlaI/MecI/CopY family transcriptional regulator [Phaeodactylibacter sp.]|nr:BlaI/MecI/CopY family transcriptional regulator [Phaeodactylibacter sp.]MCB9276406.1 BlaI/MecI/CopY family transcriptional regulator [Lewinellaceae bacterium]
MKELQAYQPSDAELEILQVLWERGALSVREVHEALSQEKSVGYTTTLKQMQRMLDKGVLARTEEGKVHYYRAVVKEKPVKRSLVRRLMDTAFGGSAVGMALHLLGEEQPSAEELKDLEKLIEQMKKEQND